MAQRKRTATCAHCGRLFSPCRYNAHHQTYCTDSACVTERKRQRQRHHYRKRYRHDESFRQAEQARCRQGIVRRRSLLAAIITPPTPAPPSLNIELFATGLLAHIIGSNDPQEVRVAAQALQQRGQSLALVADSVRTSPG